MPRRTTVTDIEECTVRPMPTTVALVIMAAGIVVGVTTGKTNSGTALSSAAFEPACLSEATGQPLLRSLRRGGVFCLTMKWITACFRTRLFASQGLPAGEGITDPRDNAVPLALLGGRVVDQYAVHEPPGKVATVVPNFPVAETGHDEEPWCSPSCIQCSRAGSSLQETQPANLRRRFGTDWTVRFARPSAVRKADHIRFPAAPASLLKIVIGKSTCAPVSGEPHISASPSFGRCHGRNGPAGKRPSKSSASKMPVSADHKVNDSRITMFRTARN